MGEGRPLFPTLEAAEGILAASGEHTDHIDLKIRPIGRPKVSTDSVLGFQRVTRRYVVEGPHASKSGISKAGDFWIYSTDPGQGYAVGDIVSLTGGGPNAGGLSGGLPARGRVTSVGSPKGDINNFDLFAGGVLYTKAPTIVVTSTGGTGYAGTAVYEPALFRPVGEPDIEFPDHYLVNQQVEPSKSMDKAYLTREFVKLRDTWYAESSSESGNLKRLSRKYAVLRQDVDYLKHLRARSAAPRDGVHPFGSASFPHGYTSQSAKDMEPYMGYSAEAFSKLPVDKLRTPVPGGQAIFSGGGNVATATAVINAAGEVSAISVTVAGEAYEGSPYLPRVLITGGGGKGAAATVDGVNATGGITGITVTSGGSGYTSNPTVTIAASHVWKQNDQDDPWDFIPRIIGATEPAGLNQANTAAAVAGSNPLGYSGFNVTPGTRATATIVFNGVPAAGDTVWIQGAEGLLASFTPQAGATAGSSFQAITVAGASAELTALINSAAPIVGGGGGNGMGGEVTAKDGPPGTVTLTHRLEGDYNAPTYRVYGPLDNSATLTGFTGGTGPATIAESLAPLGASGATGPEELKWLRGSAAVDTSNPGIDLWTCSWVAPVEPFWTTGMTKGKGFKPPVIVDFDEDGPRVSSAGTNTGGISQTRSVSSFTYFLTGTHIPPAFPGGSGSSSNIPIVSIDLRFVDSMNREFRIAKTFTNALFRLNTSGKLKFKSTDGDTGDDRIVVADKSAVEQILRFDGDDSISASPASMPWGVPPHPLYQNRKLMEVGGNITWSHNYADDATVGLSFAGTSVKSIYSHKGNHVWAVTLYYV